MIGNYDAPGIFAFYGDNYYFRNYIRYNGTQSFQKIGHQFIEDIIRGKKQPLSTRTIFNFFNVNLKNFEWF